MECLKIFEDTLTKKPYCTDDFAAGIAPRIKSIAVKKRHIQPNGPTHLRWLTFDIDQPDSGLLWDDAGLPAPNLAIMNPANGHSHYLYLLDTPVRTAIDGNPKPIKYAAAIQTAMRSRLNADPGYCGLIAKNPLNQHWKTKIWTDQAYSLGDLADYLDLTEKAANRERFDNYGLGRNCNIFNDLREYAYSAIRQANGFEQFHSDCFAYALNLNIALTSPLLLSEIKAIAKSVARWTYANFDNSKFSAIQAERGSLKGKDKRDQGIEMLKNGYSTREIMEALSVSDRTIRNWKK